jgi:hypothetical protein
LDIRLYNDANGINISEETENYLNEHVEILKKKTQAVSRKKKKKKKKVKIKIKRLKVIYSKGFLT